MNFYNYLIPEISKLSFVTLKKDIVGKGDLVLDKNIQLPLIEDATVDLKNILEGILYYFALVKDIDNRAYYLNILKKTNDEVGGVKLIPAGYYKYDTKKAMILALGLINADFYDINSFIIAGEMANVLNKELDDDHYIDIAADLFKKGLELYDNWIFSYHLGYIYYNQEEYHAALGFFEAALKSSPKSDYIEEINNLISMCNARTDYNKAFTLYEKGQYLDASIILEALAKDYGDWHNLFLLLAEAYKNMGETLKAIVSLERCIALKKPEKNMYLKLGFLYLNDAMFAKAYDLYEKANTEYPNDNEILTNLSIAAFYLKDRKKALEYIDESLKIKSDDDISIKWKEFYLRSNEV